MAGRARLVARLFFVAVLIQCGCESTSEQSGGQDTAPASDAVASDSAADAGGAQDSANQPAADAGALDAATAQDTAASPDMAASPDTAASPDVAAAPDSVAADAGAPTPKLAHPTLATGIDHACALDASGAAWCWGANGPFGKLGNGATTTSKAPVAVGGGKKFVGIWAGGMSSCALDAAGKAWCWGGGFGTGPTEVAGHTFADLTLGTTMLCGVTTAGDLLCSVTGQYKKMAENKFAQVACGNDHCCALDDKQAAWCWGLSYSANKAGELGTADTKAYLAPTAVVGGLSFNSIHPGTNYTCGLTPDNVAWCWGQGGTGTGGVSGSTPLQTKGTHLFTRFAAGTTHACGIATDKTTLCWGNNGFGQIGTGGPNKNGYVDKTVVTGGQTFVHLAASKFYSCGLTADGKAWCWGQNAGGKLGVDTDDATLGVPTAVAGGKTWMLP